MRRLQCALVLAASLTVGCFKATFISQPGAVKGREHDTWTDFFIFGLAGEETINVQSFCQDQKPVFMRTGGNFLTGLVSVLTIGIYTPRKVYVTCPGASSAQARSAEIWMDAKGTPVHLVGRSQGELRHGLLSPEIRDDAGRPSWQVRWVKEL